GQLDSFEGNDNGVDLLWLEIVGVFDVSYQKDVLLLIEVPAVAILFGSIENTNSGLEVEVGAGPAVPGLAVGETFEASVFFCIKQEYFPLKLAFRHLVASPMRFQCRRSHPGEHTRCTALARLLLNRCPV